jgi:hypothetical protein
MSSISRIADKTEPKNFKSVVNKLIADKTMLWFTKRVSGTTNLTANHQLSTRGVQMSTSGA